MSRTASCIVASCFIVLMLQCGRDGNSIDPGGTAMGTITVTSTAFVEGGMIPRAYTCDDKDFSPPLSWGNIPAGTKSIALICDDPDAPAGTWVHWLVYNMPATTKGLPEHATAARGLPEGAKQGMNDFRKKDYGGPCPPGGTHRYFFKVYALDAVLTVKEGATKAELVRSMEGRVLAQGQLMGRYKRQ